MASVFNYSSSITLESGVDFGPFDLAYETLGKLNSDKSNAILVLHALSADAHASEWWPGLIGSGKTLDTDRYFVICINAIGSCKGSTGPTDQTFPVITIGDMVTTQEKLISNMGIQKLHLVIGGSMGGMQAIEWSLMFPDMVNACLPIATAAKLSPQALGFGAVGRTAIMESTSGLSLARMIGHLTYLSVESMDKKFGRRLQGKQDYGYNFEADFQIESYLKHQGEKFIEQFDANAYLYLSKAMSYFDLEKKYGSLHKAFSKSRCRYYIISISSDLLYSSEQSKEMARTLMNLQRSVSYCEFDSPYGHDSFLVDTEGLSRLVIPFLASLQ